MSPHMAIAERYTMIHVNQRALTAGSPPSIPESVS